MGTGCTGKWQSHHRWKCSKDMWIWHLRTWFSGEKGGAGLRVGSDDLGGLCQP